MNRILCKWIVLSAVLLTPAASFAQVSCTRDGLQAATNLYVDAQTKGDPSGLQVRKHLVENPVPQLPGRLLFVHSLLRCARLYVNGFHGKRH